MTIDKTKVRVGDKLTMEVEVTEVFPQGVSISALNGGHWGKIPVVRVDRLARSPEIFSYDRFTEHTPKPVPKPSEAPVGTILYHSGGSFYEIKARVDIDGSMKTILQVVGGSIPFIVTGNVDTSYTVKEET